jgi:hypothetical protein
MNVESRVKKGLMWGNGIRALLFVLLIGGGAAGQDTTGVGSITGTVVGTDGRPAGGVKVCLVEPVRCATTNEAGDFRINDLRTGSYLLEVIVTGQASLRSEEIEVRAGLESRVEVVLPRVDAIQQSVTVSIPSFITPEEVKSSGYLVQPNEILKSAGALQDVSRYVQTLPGVVIGSNDFRNDIIVRGGSPLENLFIVDNIEIPNINSFANFASAGGTVSMLDPMLIRDVTFLTGGYPAPFINRTSSVLQIAQREGSRERIAGQATVGFAGAGGVLEGPLRKGRGSWIVSARRSFIDLFTNDIGIGGTPVNYSFNGKVIYDLSPRDRIWGVSVSGVDRIRLGAAEGLEPEEELSTLDIRYRGWRTANGLNWQRIFGDRGVGLLGVTHSEASVSARVRDLIRGGLPPINTPIDQQIANSQLLYRDDSREGETTVKYDLTLYAPVFGKVQAGGSAKIFRINYNAASPLGDDTPYSISPGVNPFSLQRQFVSSQTGAYFQATQDLTKRLNLTWGGRYDGYQYLDRSRFSPRAGISYKLTEKLSWRASFGSYYQQPFFIFISAFPENRGLLPFRADHYVTGFSYVANETLRFTVEGYRKNYRDYPVASQFPSLSLASVGDTFSTRDILFPLASAGRGRAQGIEFFAEKKFTSRWFGQTNLAFSRTRVAGLDGVMRPGTYDYPFVFNLVGGYRLTPKWEFSTRYVHLGGRPFTPFNTSASQAQRRAIFDLSRVNAERSPDYVRLDVRADYTFRIREQNVLLFIGIQNLTNRQNFAGVSWDRRNNRARFDDQLGIFPLIGLDWRF